jgi:hypothetical protein
MLKQTDDETINGLFQDIFEFLPKVACVLNKDNLNVLFANQKFSECIVDRELVVGQNFLLKILNKSGGVDFMDKLSVLKKSKCKHIIAERVETLSFLVSGLGTSFG